MDTHTNLCNYFRVDLNQNNFDLNIGSGYIWFGIILIYLGYCIFKMVLQIRIVNLIKRENEEFRNFMADPNAFVEEEPIKITTQKYACPYCPKIMNYKANMERHILFCESRISQQKKSPKPNTNLICKPTTSKSKRAKDDACSGCGKSIGRGETQSNILPKEVIA